MRLQGKQAPHGNDESFKLKGLPKGKSSQIKRRADMRTRDVLVVLYVDSLIDSKTDLE